MPLFAIGMFVLVRIVDVVSLERWSEINCVLMHPCGVEKTSC